jgi:hypothetical protein
MEGSHLEIKERLAEQSEALRAARAAGECSERRLREVQFEWRSKEAALTEAQRHAEQELAQLQVRPPACASVPLLCPMAANAKGSRVPTTHLPGHAAGTVCALTHVQELVRRRPPKAPKSTGVHAACLCDRARARARIAPRP